MTQPYDPKADPDSARYQSAHERSGGDKPYNARTDPSSPHYRNVERDLSAPVAGSLVSGILLVWIVSPAVWGIAAGLYRLVSNNGEDAAGFLVTGGVVAGAVAIVGFVRIVRAVRVLAARSDRAAARELADERQA